MVTGKPVKFLGVGEKLDALEEFRPEGMAQRILGMGDIVGLVQSAMENFDQEETAKLQAKMEKGTFTLEDFMAQMAQVKKMGPMGKVMGMIPGMGDMMKQVNMKEGDIEKSLKRMQAMYQSMTTAERKKPDVIEHGRRRRIARGAAVDTGEVSKFIKDRSEERRVGKECRSRWSPDH